MKIIQKSIGLFIIIIVIIGLVITINNYEKQKIYIPVFVNDQAERFNVHALENTNLKKISNDEISMNINNKTYQLNIQFALMVIFLLIYSVPGIYLTMSNKVTTVQGSVLLLLTIINTLTIVFWGGSTDSGISFATFIVPVVSLLYFIIFVAVLLQNRKKL